MHHEINLSYGFTSEIGLSSVIVEIAYPQVFFALMRLQLVQVVLLDQNSSWFIIRVK